jgi:hypothetical protein
LEESLRIELIKFEIKDYFLNYAKIQGSNCIDPGVKLKNKREKILKSKDWIAKHQNVRGQNEE